jgi:hypothetical protein
MIRAFMLKSCLLLASAVGASASAQQRQAHTATPDAAWLRASASPYNPSDMQQDSMPSMLNWDPRLRALLRASFHQRQWFWYDHYKFTPLPELIPILMGIPGDAILDDQRYMTLDGCLAHVCDADRGVLWIDTGVRPAQLIFTAVNINSGDLGNTSHLWVFGSSKLDWQHLPGPFLKSLARWRDTIAAKGYRQTGGYMYNFSLATIVQPSGEQIDISPSLLHLDSPVTAIATGAKQ